MARCVYGCNVTPYPVRNYVNLGVNKLWQMVVAFYALNLRVEGSIPSRFINVSLYKTGLHIVTTFGVNHSSGGK